MISRSSTLAIVSMKVAASWDGLELMIVDRAYLADFVDDDAGHRALGFDDHDLCVGVGLGHEPESRSDPAASLTFAPSSERRDDHNGDGQVGPLQAAQHADPVEARHLEVEREHFGTELLARLQRLVADRRGHP
jgi:hypothetical protein